MAFGTGSVALRAIADGLPIGEAISRLLEHPTRRLTGRELLALGLTGELLQGWGAFEEMKPLKAIRCQSCDEDHEVDLEFDQDTRAYTYYCGSAGFVRAADEDVRLFRCNHEWLMARLAESLGIRTPRHRELVASHLWDLGDADLSGASARPWAVFLARGVPRVLDAILDALQTRGRKQPGFVLTSSANAPWHLKLPHGYRFIPLEEALEVHADTLTVVPAMLIAALGGRHAGQRQQRAGRPTTGPLALDLFDARKRARLTLTSVRDEAKAIREQILEQHPHLEPPAIRTVENNIRAGHIAWRGADARRTK
jgi:hypothetical protein